MAEESLSRGSLFTIGNDVYGWDDVVALAKLRGEWAALAGQARVGMAALAELEERGDVIPNEDVEAAARRFRYERDLLAGDELVDWLDRHDLTNDDWDAYLRRWLARERRPAPERSVSDREVEALIWPEGICSGQIERLAHELAELAAVSPGMPVERLDASFDAFCAGALDEKAAAREVETNRLEWLRFAYDVIEARDDDTAREAALCVRADGEELTAVAERAGLAVHRYEGWLDEIEPALATRLLSATPGDVVGPVAANGSFVVARVASKTAPLLEDPDVRSRADDAVLSRIVGRMVADRVVWL